MALDGANRWGARLRRETHYAARVFGRCGVDIRDGLNVSVQDDLDRFESLPGRAHPGAKRGRMGRCFMMSMVRGVRNCLGIDQTAEK